MELYRNIEILKYEKDNYRTVTDKIIVEREYNLFINGDKRDIIYCSPDNLRELVTGYLFAKDLINTVNNIIFIKIDSNNIDLKIKRVPTRKINNKVLDIVITPAKVFRIVKTLTKSSELFKETGGVHNVLLCTSVGEKIVFREDISRNNAINKVIGNILIQDIKPFDKLLAVSCRVSGQIMGKIIKIGIPVVISLSAPTDRAIRMARENRITLIGFAREDRMNVYSDNPKNRRIEL